MVMSVISGYVSSLDLQSLIGEVIGVDSGAGLLLNDVEYRKNQFNKLGESKKLFKAKSGNAIKVINETKVTIEKLSKETDEKLRDASVAHEGLLKQKQVVLSDRIQNFLNFKDLWLGVEEKLLKHEKLVKDLISLLQSKKIEADDKVAYSSWKDLDVTKKEVDQLEGELEAEKSKQDSLKKFKTTEKEEIALFKKEIAVKVAEKEKIAKELAGHAESEDGVGLLIELKLKADIVEQEITYLKEKVEVSEFKIEISSIDERYKEDEIFLLRQKKRDTNKKFEKIQARLLIDVADVEIAKNELEKEKESSAIERSIIIKRRSREKKALGAKSSEIKDIEKRYDVLKKAGKSKTPEGYSVEAKLLQKKHEALEIDRSLDLLNIQYERLKIIVKISQVKAEIIEILYTLRSNKDKIDDWFSDFKTKLRRAIRDKNLLRYKADAISALKTSINVNRKALLVKRKELEAEREKVFSGNGKYFAAAINSIRDATSALDGQMASVESNSSQVSELLLRQDEVIKQYTFIIKYFSSQMFTGRWKRSSRAISIEQLWQSLLEAEGLLKGLFWATPGYIGPTGIVQSIKTFSVADYLGIILFFLLFIFLFIVSRVFLAFAHRNIRSWLSLISSKFSHAFTKGAEEFFAFMRYHCSLMFTWLFVFVHIAFGLQYFRPLAASYSITLFYLVTIPILIHLSRSFILRLREVNHKHDYLFISEPLEKKITTLIEIFLYATATLLPLRKAFLTYFDRRIAFSEVSLAAYTLILVVIILFFFNKDDVLRLLSGRNALIIWLRKKVDRYYYPVFICCMLLLILSNPYVGYSNLAWYLIFALPASLFLIYGLFIVHYVIRKFSLSFFIKEEDDEVTNKFDHAKAYYGFFVAVTFVTLACLTLLLFARIWGVEGYTIQELWQSLSEDWTVKIGKDKLGLIEFIKLASFIASGLLISSLIKKFILGRLFEIFRTEPGVQNTVSKIFHYCVIILALILGFGAINLTQYAVGGLALMLVGVSIAFRDQIADYLAGILVLLERPVEIGHYVEAGEFAGKVHRISARSTTLKTARNFFITIPNRDLIAKPIVNWGKGRYAVGAQLKIMVAFNSDPKLVKETLLSVMKDHSMVLRVPAPLVRFEGFEDSALFFYCRCYISARKVLDMWDLESDLRFAVMQAFKENDIVIPFPQTVLHFAKKCKKDHSESDGFDGKKPEPPTSPIEIKFDTKGE